MLECINKECIYNKNKECTSGAIVKQGVQCDGRIKPTHTPTYAEEQLNHAIEKEYECYSKKCNRCIENKCTATNVYKVCVNRESKPINYEEEYNKLKKESEEQKEDSENYIKEIKEHIGYIGKIQAKNKELNKEIDSLKLKAAVTEKLEIEINNLNEIIERKEKEINDLQVSHNIIEQENNQQKFQMKELGKIIDEGEEEIKELKTRMENRQVAIKSLSEGKQKLKESIEIKNVYITKIKNVQVGR
jgi:chromosome segregation ATPase